MSEPAERQAIDRLVAALLGEGGGGAAEQGEGASRARQFFAPRDAEAPLFRRAEDVVRCWAGGIPGGCKALPIEREGGSGSEVARASRLFDRSERYAVACAVMRRAKAAGLTEAQEVVLYALLHAGLSWDQAADIAGLYDEALAADSVKRRVYRSLQAGLALVAGAM